METPATLCEAVDVRTKLRKRTYTREEGEIILAGLRQGARPRKPMSDAEWEQLADPRGYYERQMVSHLSDIRDSLEDRRDTPQRKPEPQKPWQPEPTPKSGVIKP